MANPPFVPLSKPHSAWEPLLRAPPEPPRSGGASVLAARARSAEAPVAAQPPPPPPTAEAKALAALRAEWEAKEAARAKEHAAALAQLQQVEAETQARLERLTQLCAAVEASRKQLLLQLRTGAATLILEAAHRIAGDALRTQPELLDRLVGDATDALGKEGLVLYVGSADAQHLRTALKGTGIQVDIDPRMSAGLRAESPAGRLDASMETALRALASVMDEWRKAAG